MNNRKSPMILMGFWSDAEKDFAMQVRRIPELILQSKPLKQDIVTMNDKELLSQNIYNTLLPALKLLNSQLISIDKFQYEKVCELTVPPKQNSTAQTLNLTMYHVFSDEFKSMNYFFLVDEKQNDVAYARFEYNENSSHVASAYSNHSFIALDAIESKKRGEYSLAPILVQAVLEHSLNAGSEGRMVLYSANKTGKVYFNYGFTPLKEEIFEKLYYSGEKHVDGEVMFLTNLAIDAWKEKINTHPLLSTSAKHIEEGLKK